MLIFFYSCSIDVCFVFALKSKFTLLHLSFFIVLIVSWVTPKTNQEPMALLVCAVWNQVVKNNVFVSQLTFTFHPLTLTPMWCHHAARVVWSGRTLQTLISRERPLTSAVLKVLNLRCCVQTHKQNLNSGPFNEFDSKGIWALFINWKWYLCWIFIYMWSQCAMEARFRH